MCPALSVVSPSAGSAGSSPHHRLLPLPRRVSHLPEPNGAVPRVFAVLGVRLDKRQSALLAAWNTSDCAISPKAWLDAMGMASRSYVLPSNVITVGHALERWLASRVCVL